MIPDAVTSIGSHAFDNATSLSSVMFGNGLETLGTYAFQNCEELTSADLSNTKIKTLSSNTFSGCKKLRSVNLPETLTTIDNSVFYNCADLEEVIIQYRVTTINNSAFNGVSTSLKIYGWIGSYAETFAAEKGFMFIPIGLLATSIEMQKNLTAYVGVPAKITAELTYPDSEYDVEKEAVTWSSSNTSVVTVDKDGNLTPLSKGRAIITGTIYKSSAFTNVTINESELTIKDTAAAIKVGETYNPTVTTVPDDGTSYITWTSDDTRVASVDSTGKVTGISVGTTIIHGTLGNATASYTIDVLPNEMIVAVTGISLSKDSTTLVEGNTETLVATVLPENATNKNVTWTSSDPEYVTVDAQGKVTAVKATDKPVTVTVTTEDGSYTATCAVTVTAKVINVESVSLNKTELSKVEGETETLVATVLPENATNKNVTWTSSDSEYVTVDAQGKVTAVKATDKPVTVTVTTEDGDFTAVCQITVEQLEVIPAQSMIYGEGFRYINVGQEKKLNVITEPSNATLTWTSKDESIAVVNSDGLVMGVSEGTTTITVASGQFSLSFEIQVIPYTIDEWVTLYEHTVDFENKTVTLNHYDFDIHSDEELYVYGSAQVNGETFEVILGRLVWYFEGRGKLNTGNKVIKKIEFVDKMKLPADSTCMFWFLEELSSLNIENLIFDDVESMHGMFVRTKCNYDFSGYSFPKLTDISSAFASVKSDYVSFKDVSAPLVTTTDSMFSNSDITEIDLTNFSTPNNKTTYRMFFQDYSSLDQEQNNSVILSGMDTSEVENMSGMFWNSDFKSLDLSGFNTSNVTDMGHMFAECSYLETVNLGNFDTSEVTGFGSMFNSCVSLKTLDLSSFNTTSVNKLGLLSMFNNCSALQFLDISSFDLTNISATKLLQELTSLTELIAPAEYGSNSLSLPKPMYYLKDGQAVSTDSISSEVGSKTYLVTDLSKLVTTDKIQLNSYEETMIPGQTFELEAIFENDDAVPTDLVFTSSNTSVASVNANGVITAISGGDAVILVSSASHSASAECLVHVDDTYYDFKIAFDTGLDDEEIEHGRIVIRKYIGSDTEVGIPEEINGYPVEFIDYEAFKDNKTLVKVVVPSTVTDIYRNAFEGCTSLNEVYLNEGIRYIDDQAFKGCTSLTDFVFPSTFESAGEKLFEGCTALEVIMLNDNLETISKGMFAGMKSAVEISVPASVKVIEENAFADSDIVSIEFEGDDIETIGAYAFRNCNNLEVLHVPSVEVIPAGFFSGTGLKEVSIPESVKEIKETAFQGAVSLQTVRYAGNKEGWDEISIGSENDPLLNAYLICEDGLVPVQSITLLPEEIWIKEGSSFAIETEFSPAQTTYQDVIWEFDEEHLTYEDGIFTAAKKGSYEGTITAVSAENKDISAECSVRIVGDDELYPLTPHMIKLPVGASFQMEMYDPNSLLDSTYVSWESSDEELAVVDDHGLVTVKGYGVLKITLTVHDEITYSWDVWTENQCSIYNGFVYSGSTILGYVGTDTDVTVPSVINGATITAIAQIAFDSNERLVSVTVPDTVKNIGMGAFESCPNLRTVKLPEGLTELQQGLFMYCSSLKKIDLPDSLTEIGPAAFSDSGLTEIDIPESVESIGMSAFVGCTELEKVTIHSGLARIASYAFRGCNKVTELDLPLSLTKIGDAVFGDYDNTMTVNYAGSRADWNNIKIGYDNESWLKNIVCAIRGITIEPIDSMVYTGSALKPKVTIYDDGALLKAGTHYTVTYKNNTKAASKDSETPPTVIIKMRGNYSGTETRTFDILPRDITQDEVTIISANYTGTVQKVSPTITDNKKTLKKNIDYTLSYPSAGDYKEPGKYEVVASGIGNYTGTRKFELQIASADQVNLSKTTITIPKSSYPYNNGAAIEPVVTVKSGRVVVDPGRYTVTYTNNTQCGTATVTVEGDGIYSVGTKSKTFKITGTALSKAIAASAVKKTIERNETPEILVKNKASFNLVEGKDYEIEYPDTSKAGKLYVLVNGINGYTGTVKVAITVNKDSLAKTATLTVADTVHVKSGAKPEVTVKATDGTILVEGVDYTVKYANNKKAAEKTAAKAPTVTVTGIGNYTGTLTAKFSIAVKELTNSMVEYAADINATTKKGAFTTTLVIKDVDGKALTANTDYDMKNAVYTRDDVVLTKLDTVNAGDVITVTVNGKGNYNGTVSAQFRVTEKVNNISSASVKIADKQYLNGTPVTLDEKDFTSAVLNKEPLTYGVDYEIADIKYPYTNNTKKGTATVRIHGIGKYAGYATVKFKIVARAIQENLVP